MSTNQFKIPRTSDSKSAWLKYYVMELLEDQEMYYIPEIVAYIEQRSGHKVGIGEYFTGGMLTGVLDRLTKGGEYINMDKGTGLYCKANMIIKEDIEVACNNILKGAVDDIYEKLSEVNVVNLSEQEYKGIQNIKDTIFFIESQIKKGKNILLCREYIVKLLRDCDQEPYVVKSKDFKRDTGTIIKTKSKGAFYILEYNADGRIGWSLSDNRLQHLKQYDKYAVVFLNQKDAEIFIVLDNDTNFYNSLVINNGSCRLDRRDLYNLEATPVINYKISEEDFVDYLDS